MIYEAIKSAIFALPGGQQIIDKTYALWQRLLFGMRYICQKGRAKPITMRSEGAFRDGLLDLISHLANDCTMAEIGSYRGESTELFLKSGKVSQIFCIDPWKPFYDSNDAASYTDMQQVENDFDSRFRNNPHVIKVKGTIDDFAAMPHINLDFVYIDACHTYEATKHDIRISLTTLKPAFAIGGHDYTTAGGGVKQAVDEIFGVPDLIFDDTSWIKFL